MVPRAADLLGRKWIVLISSIIFAVAYAGMMFASNIYLFYCFAMLSGLAFAGRFSVAFVYLMELLPAENRTFVGSLYFSIASVVGVSSALIYKYFHTASFRNFAYLGFAITIFGIIMIAFLPESPIYLLQIN